MQRTVRPARDGLIVLKPGGLPLAPEGEPVEWSVYWQRRLRDGDVTLVEAPEAAGEAPARAAEGGERRRAR